VGSPNIIQKDTDSTVFVNVAMAEEDVAVSLMESNPMIRLPDERFDDGQLHRLDSLDAARLRMFAHNF
jgi:hypothetical protein